MPAEPVERSAIPERRNLDGMFRGMLTRLPLIACSLDAAGQRERLFEWKQLLATAERRTVVPDGVKFVFAAEGRVEEHVRELAAAEQACCGFFEFQVTRDRDHVEMTVVAPAEAQAALRFLF
jgi:hypothetical protein